MEKRAKMLKQYAELDKEGNPKVDEQENYMIKPENQLEWNKGALELLSIETDINISKINLNALEGLKISPSELTSIDFMVKE